MLPKLLIASLAFFVSAMTGCDNAAVKTDTVISEPISDTAKVNPDSVLYSFVFMGCNRIDKDQLNDSNTNASTANLPELQRTFTEVSALKPRPVFFFFLGDEVLGLTQTQKDLQHQLKAWRKQYADTSFSPISASGIKMIAIPGNHESLYQGKDKNGDKAELPNSIALAAWMKEMSAFVPDSGTVNRVTGPDSLNNLATYSFTYSNTRFIMINTDTYNAGDTIGMAPAAWINADILAAKKDTTVKHIFLLGHKPAVVSKKLYKANNDDIMDVSVVKSIWPIMDSNKVEAMLSAHSHQYNRIQPDSGMAYQIIAGNGGSPYEGALQQKDSVAHQYYGYTIVYVMKNNNVILQSMGRTVKYKNYLRSLSPADITTVRDRVNIKWGTNAGTYARQEK